MDDAKLVSGRSAADVLRDSRRQRTKWYELDSPRAVQIRLPQAGELFDLRKTTAASEIRDLLGSWALDWRNFTEADLLGDQGGNSPLPFSRDVFEEWIFDRVETMYRLAGRVLEDAKARSQLKEDAAKNSETS